jgi:hypothetical protein
MVDPFERHRSKTESQPDQPDSKIAEANAVDQPVGSKPVEGKSSPASPFSRHADEKRPRTQPRLDRPLKLAPSQALLDWLVRDQARSIVTVRDICRLGPGQIRNRERALDSAKILVEHGG